MRVLPVPDPSEVEDGTAARIRTARERGAGRLLAGALSHEGDVFRVNLNLVDTVTDRILWATTKEVQEERLAMLVTALARDVLAELGVARPRQYESIEQLSGPPAMTELPEFMEAIGAVVREDPRLRMEASERLVEKFPAHPTALVLRAHALSNVFWGREGSAEESAALEASLAKLDAVDPDNPYSQFLRAYQLTNLGSVQSSRELMQESARAFTAILSRTDLAPAATS